MNAVAVVFCASLLGEVSDIFEEQRLQSTFQNTFYTQFIYSFLCSTTQANQVARFGKQSSKVAFLVIRAGFRRSFLRNFGSDSAIMG